MNFIKETNAVLKMLSGDYSEQFAAHKEEVETGISQLIQVEEDNDRPLGFIFCEKALEGLPGYLACTSQDPPYGNVCTLLIVRELRNLYLCACVVDYEGDYGLCAEK